MEKWHYWLYTGYSWDKTLIYMFQARMNIFKAFVWPKSAVSSIFRNRFVKLSTKLYQGYCTYPEVKIFNRLVRFKLFMEKRWKLNNLKTFFEELAAFYCQYSTTIIFFIYDCAYFFFKCEQLPGFVQNSLLPVIGRSYSPLGLRMPTEMWSPPPSSLIKASIR